ncbi:MAG: glycoside hydrolase family 44 protein, partial [Acidimicrobiales bacterium]
MKHNRFRRTFAVRKVGAATAAVLVGAMLPLGGVARAFAASARPSARPSSSPSAAAGPPAATIVIDTSKGPNGQPAPTPISSLIYGLNAHPDGFASETGLSTAQTLADLGITFVRDPGGDATTAFNWENNSTNLGTSDSTNKDNNRTWHAVPAGSTTPGAHIQPTIDMDNAATTPIQTMFAVSMGDHSAANSNDTGPVTLKDNPTSFVTHKMTGPIPQDTTDPTVYENQYVNLIKTHNPNTPFYVGLENEPDAWDSTHANIYPDIGTTTSGNLSWTDFINRSIAYAGMVKGIMPNATVTGPVDASWQGQFDPTFVDCGPGCDGHSQDYKNLQADPATAGQRFLDVYLQKMHAAETQGGTHLLDLLDLHWYPLFAPGGSSDADTNAVREQRPRSLWDPNYIENSYIPGTLGDPAQPIQLIPRLQQQIAAADPNLPIGITEWDYGNFGTLDIGTTIADADTLGIFGKFGVKLATLWPLSFNFAANNGGEDFAYGAFKAFRNYDGHGAHFGDTEVSATSSDTATTTNQTELSSVYASINQADPTQVVIVAINKDTSVRSASIQVKSSFQTSAAAVYTLTQSGGATPVKQPDIGATGANTFTYSMPAQSVSVIVPTKAGPAPVFYAKTPPTPAATTLPYSYTFGATGTPTPTYSTDQSKLPNGLTLDASGVLSGTPTVTGTFDFTVTATNSVNSASAPCEIIVQQGQPPLFVNDSPPTHAEVLSPYTYTFTASGFPSPTFSADQTKLPPGITLDGNTGVLAGTPTAVGSSTFTVTAHNGVLPDATSQSHTINVTPPAPGTVLGWGANKSGELGQPGGGNATIPIKAQLPAGVAVKKVAGNKNVASEFTLALTSDGKVYAWGNNNCGQLGNGTDTNCGDAPVPTPTPAIVAVPAG